VQASDEVITKSRVGGYPREHLFPLRQSWQAYRYYQSLITTCDQEMAEQLQNLDSPMPPDASPWPPERYPHRPRKNEFRFDLRSERYRIYGTDLTAIPSLNALTGYTVLAEVGTDWSKFRNGMLLLPGRASVPKTKRAEVRFSRPTPAGVPTG
jgi:hypothetical protein